MNTGTSTLLAATEQGLVIAARSNGALHEETRSLVDRDVTGVVSREGVILAATTSGVFRSDDCCKTWMDASDGLRTRHVRWLAFHPDISDREFAGTEPAGIFVSRNGGGSWRSCEEVAELRDKHGWWLPYSPEAGCIRSFAFHGRRAYAAVEVGGVLRSDDEGETWRLAGGSTGQPVFDIPPAPYVFADVHWVSAHPSSVELVFAATAEGLYRSSDGGDTWTVTHAGSYCRAVWIDPMDADHLILGPADSVSHKNGRIEESRDGGQNWGFASTGLDLPWPDRMVERFSQIGDELYAITNDGRLYITSIGARDQEGATLQWKQGLPDAKGIRAVARYRT